MIKKIKSGPINFLFAALIILGFETFYSYQLRVVAYIEAILALLIIILTTIQSKSGIGQFKKDNAVDFGFKVIFLHALLAIISIFTTKSNFDQDLINSLINSRYLIVCYAMIFCTSHYLYQYKNSQYILEIITNFCTSFCIIYLTITFLNLDNLLISALNTDESKIIYFKDYSELFGRERFKITYIPAIYLILNIKSKHWKLLFTLGVTTLFFAAAGRMLWVSLILTFSIYVLKKHIALGSIFILLTIFVVFLLNVANIVNFDAFFDILDLLKNSETSDMSLIVRAEEIEIALNILKDNIIFGVGSISYNQFEGGYDFFYGRYAPSDIGLIGVASVYGILGIFIQTYTLVKSFKYLKNGEIFWYYFFIYNIFGIFTGSVIFKPFSYLTLLSVCILNGNIYKSIRLFQQESIHPLYTSGHDHAILTTRYQVYEQARQRHPSRWRRHTRNWQPVGAVTLNPEREAVVEGVSGNHDKQPLAA